MLDSSMEAASAGQVLMPAGEAAGRQDCGSMVMAGEAGGSHNFDLMVASLAELVMPDGLMV
jgi:hypothetical protein